MAATPTNALGFVVTVMAMSPPASTIPGLTLTDTYVIKKNYTCWSRGLVFIINLIDIVYKVLQRKHKSLWCTPKLFAKLLIIVPLRVTSQSSGVELPNKKEFKIFHFGF